ncbi:alpha/beta fold hydrolase [Virgibacillus sp. SK37]|uniref:alpha/beta fold hydrolase n=1 Tax=Virgibacillus sp. SK37 TaxID=403957 RepID=UPI0004D1FD1B|nr:alpha/beta fold hydrolase [Virgibacillus sp. SK37]AIF42753.1 esterase [Virgibacillus sp. SK37]
MIGIEKHIIDEIPCLVVGDTSKKKEALPTVLYFHGFTSAKEHNLPLAYLLAEKGYRVILPDSEYHGEREQDVSSRKVQVSFWEIVMNNVKELKVIKEALEEKGLILNGRFGIAGTSMGGITTSAALAHYPWIRTAAILMGSPKITTYAKTLVDSFKKMGDLPVTDEMINYLYEQLEQYDLSKQPEKLNQRALLLWHGENDPVVPFDHSYTFYEEAKKQYKNQADIKFLKEANRGHKVSRYAILETVKWFEDHL